MVRKSDRVKRKWSPSDIGGGWYRTQPKSQEAPRAPSMEAQMRKPQTTIKSLSELGSVKLKEREEPKLQAEQPKATPLRERAPEPEQPKISLEIETSYEVPDVVVPKNSEEERWLKACITRGKKEIFLERRTLTHALARLLLDRNPDNRKSSRSVIKKYVEEMQAGAFNSLNGETIHVSREGLLNNGQSRLEAVLISGVVQEFLIMFGIEREARMTVDQGRKRTGADYLDMRGIRGTRDAVAVAQMLWQFRSYGQLTRASEARLSASQVAAYAEENFADISEALRFIPRQGANMVGGVPFLAFVLMTLGGRDQAAAIQFVTDLIRGSELPQGSPILILRNRFINDRRLNRAERLELIIKAWNAHRAGERVDRLWLNKNMPEIAG